MTIDAIKALPAGIRARVKYGETASSRSTMRIGGIAECLIELSSPEEIKIAAAALIKEKIFFRLLGRGSNALLPDEGLEGVTIVYADGGAKPEIRSDGLRFGGSADLDAVVKACVEAGTTGLEELSGIPGTLGGAIYGNAGAFGRQIGEFVVSLEIAANDGSVETISRDECGFSYRDSAFKRNGAIIVSATLKGAASDAAKGLARRAEILSMRRDKHPDVFILPSCGSFFKNSDRFDSDGRRIAAGYFLDQCGAKGMRVNDACVYHKHANIIVNLGAAKARDVIELAKTMRSAVKDKFGVTLEPEVQIWNKSPQGANERPF